MILVTGASGNVGSAVMTALSKRGVTATAGARSLDKVTRFPAVHLDFNNASTFSGALAGVESVLLVSPPVDGEAPRKLGLFIDQAKSMGTGHIVLISAFGVAQNEEAPLRKVEVHLLGSGIACTIIRPNFFMENFTTGFLGQMIKNQGAITLPAAEGKTSFIATRDIADVAATALLEKHAGKQYNLTGPDALTYGEAAEIISEAAGVPVLYQSLSEMMFLLGARATGRPESTVKYLGDLFAAVRAGRVAPVTDEVERVTGHKPLSFREFATENAKAWSWKN